MIKAGLIKCRKPLISREFIADFNEMSEKIKSSIYNKLEAKIKNQLSTFEPNHDTPLNTPGAVEKWEFTSAVLMC
ncbi:hypothetical protein MNBD_GAMMA12-2912 [hydrothermal vent metagenome]|uniref:Uncharacterized protein n=1 Tax=hydrothermal vent metagenome TaxID=652676 RepID=A0A3B0YTJ2_9ZZZZ